MKDKSGQRRKTIREKRSEGLIALFLLYVMLTVSGLMLFKMGHVEMYFETGSLGFETSWKSLIGIFCYMLSFILWLVIVSKGELSLVMPLSAGIVNIAVVLSAYLVLHEKITNLQWMGTFVVIIGLILMNWKR